MLSRDISKAIINTSGAPLALMLPRCKDFGFIHDILRFQFYKSLNIRIVLASWQMLLDPAEVGGWLSSFRDKPLGQINKTAYLLSAVGDETVTNIGSHILARGLGAVTMAEQSSQAIFGVASLTGPITGKTLLTEWTYLSNPPVDSIYDVPAPSSLGDTHPCPIQEAETITMAQAFIKTGSVSNFCGGKCSRAACPSPSF